MFVGTDIVEVDRIKNAILRGEMCFLQRVFTSREIMKINVDEMDFERAAGFWAAKESIVKAIGLGFRNGIRFHDAEIVHDAYGCPHFTLHGRLQEIMVEKNIKCVSLSISHCRIYAIAVTVIN